MICITIISVTSAGMILTCQLFKALKKVDLRGNLSAFCEKISRDPVIASDLARDAFSQTPVSEIVPTIGHTHPTAAGLRTSATNFARNVTNYSGTRLYVVGMSKSDQRKDLRGSRQWYWAKDTNVENRDDPRKADDIMFVCDVDYYLDMPKMLIDSCKPTLLYTVVPDTACSSGIDDTSTCFDENGCLVTLVAGGGSYHHHLWNYGYDSIMVQDTTFGFVSKIVVYAVERKQIAVNRQIILLTPIRSFHGLAAWIASFLLEGHALERFNPIVKASDGSKFVRFTVHNAKGTVVTVSRPNSFLCATVDASIDAAIAGAARLGTTKLMLPTTASWLGKEKEFRAQAVVLTEFYRLCQHVAPPVVFPVEAGVRTYQYEPEIYDQEAKPKIQSFMSPLVHGAFAPVLNEAGERRCVEGRINSLKKPEPKPHSFRDNCVNEFAELVVRGMELEPVCYEVVDSKQTSATQKLSLAKAVVHGHFRKCILKCFGKAEAYPDVKDPRNISMYNDADKLDMATFALALAEHCKQFEWYAPGKKPLEIAQRVAHICMNAEAFVNVSDFHRMDGTVSYALRQVERVTCMKAFTRHRAKLNELLKTNVNNKGHLPLGTTFDQGSAHGSGCSATSVFQTLRAAFAAYLGFRNSSHPTGGRYSPKQAFSALGIHLGDDGLDADLQPRNHLWSCNKIGLLLETSLVHRGDRGVNFLARYYSPEVWYGCPNSMCDIKRQLSKFHTTVRLPNNVTPEQKLVEKCMSYVATDCNTPVMGDLCREVLVLSTYRPKTPLGIGNWWSQFDYTVQYPNENVGGWMDVEFNCLFPEFSRSRFDFWLAGASSISKILEAPLCAEPKAATAAVVDVVVDGYPVQARSSSESKIPKSQEKEETTSVSSNSSGNRRRNRRKREGNSGPKERSGRHAVTKATVSINKSRLEADKYFLPEGGFRA